MSKRKDKNKNKKEEPTIPEKYVPENQIETFEEKVGKNLKNEDLLTEQMTKLNEKFNELHINHIKNTEKLNKNLEDKQRENAYLYEEIREIRDQKEEFERSCKENFEKKFEEVEEEKMNAIEEITNEMNILKENLSFALDNKKELEEKVRKLEAEIERLNHVNNITKNNYINKIKDLNEKHHIKIKNTIERFESFLSNNQELLNKDLYTVYRELKLKFELKLKECVEFKKKNAILEKINREYKLDMDNNEDIINICAKEQTNIKKKTMELMETLNEKNKIIEIVKNEYQKQVDLINNKYSQILEENALEIQNLKNEIEDRNKRIFLAQQNSKEVLNSRSELELFFIDQLKQCRKEIIKKRKQENDKKNCYLPYLNKSANLESKNVNNNSSTLTQDENVYVTSMKQVDIKDMDPELKEKLLRNLLIKFNEGGIDKGFKKLRNEIK
jgi:hypothetical protein